MLDNKIFISVFCKECNKHEVLGFEKEINNFDDGLMRDIHKQITKAANGLEMFKQYCTDNNCKGFVEMNSKKPIGKCLVCGLKECFNCFKNHDESIICRERNYL
jgi:hypothetical protein